MHPAEILPYLKEYVKTNHFTGILFGWLLFLVAFKYLFGRRPVWFGAEWVRRREVWALFSVCALGFFLRLGWIVSSDYRPTWSYEQAAEMKQSATEYDGINIDAAAIKRGVWFHHKNGSPVARRPIGYPTALGALYGIFGARYAVLYAFNLLLAVLTIFFIYHLARQMFDERVGAVAAFFFAVYPLSIYAASLSLDEHLFLPMWYGGLLLLFQEIRGKKVSGALFWYGVIFGYATMTRTHTIFMPLVVGFVYLRLGRSWKKVAIAVVAVYAMTQLMTAPWAVRNYRIWKTYIPYSASWADIYSGANASVKRGDYNGNWPSPGDQGYVPEYDAAVARQDAAEIQSIARRETMKWMRENPGDFLILGIERLLHLMAANRARGVWPIDLINESLKHRPDLRGVPLTQEAAQEMAFGAYYLALYSFFFGSIWLMRRWKVLTAVQRLSIIATALCLLLYLGEQFLVYPERKYRYPLEPFLIIVASAFWVHLACEFRFGRTKKLA